MPFRPYHPRYFVLDENHVAFEVDDPVSWGRWLNDPDNRRVAFTELAGGVYVSTVFLGLNLNFSGKGPPVLFETKAFTDYGGSEQERYSTWAEAQVGHNRIVETIRVRMRVPAERK